MTHAATPWPHAISWETVLEINRALCDARQAPHQLRSPGHSKAQELWEQSSAKTLSLLDLIETCRHCSDFNPFVCANATTFAEIGNRIITEATAHLPAVEGQIVRTTVSHYIAGRVLQKELMGIWPLFKAETQREEASFAAENSVSHPSVPAAPPGNFRPRAVTT